MTDNSGSAFPNDFDARSYGMTLRQYYAAKAMQGLICIKNTAYEPERVAFLAVQHADALIAALKEGE